MQRLGLQLGAEVLLDELLAQRLADLVVHQRDAALPQRRQLGHAAQRAAVVVEVLVHERLRQERRRDVRHVPAQVGLDLVELAHPQLEVERLEEPGLADVEAVVAGQAHAGEVRRPVERGGQGLQLARVGGMEELSRIALLHLRHRSLGERRLDRHDRVGMRLRVGGAVAHQLEHARDVQHVLVAQLPGPGVRLRVVVAIGQPQAPLAGEGDRARGVGIVLPRAEREEQAVVAGIELQRGEHGGQIRLRAHAVDEVQRRLQRTRAQRLREGVVGAGREGVADLLLRQRAAIDLHGQAIEDAPQHALVVLLHLAVDVPAGLVGGDRVVLLPAAAAVLVEVDAGIDGPVHGRDVEHRRVGQAGERRGGRSRGRRRGRVLGPRGNGGAAREGQRRKKLLAEGLHGRGCWETGQVSRRPARPSRRRRGP